MSSQWARDKSFGRQGGRIVPWESRADKFHRGQLVQFTPAPVPAGAMNGEGVTVVVDAVGPDTVTVSYGDVHNLTVPAARVEPLLPSWRPGDGHTSQAAAAMQTPVKLYKAHRQILIALVEAGRRGLTDFELAAVTGRKQTSFGVRRGELTKACLVEYAEQDRPSDTGAMAKVWRITDAGVRVWRDQIAGAA